MRVELWGGPHDGALHEVPDGQLELLLSRPPSLRARLIAARDGVLPDQLTVWADRYVRVRAEPARATWRGQVQV